MIVGTRLIFAFSIVIFKILCQSIDSPCTLESSGFPGKCKLMSDCSYARDQLIIHHRLPQVCGFEETQSIVCCPLNGTMVLNGTEKRKPGEISRAKCREYSLYALRQPSGEVAECGHRTATRIVGGENASRTEFPHMAAVGFQGGQKPEEIKWLCGGILISDRYILTAATCRNGGKIGDAKFVKLGTTDLKDDDKRNEFRIAEFVKHPDYHLPAVYNDIGLIKLEKPVTLHSHARPACLFTEDAVSEKTAIATGWGGTNRGVERSYHLLKVTLDLVTHEVCKKSFKDALLTILPRGIDEETHICAGSEVDAKDTCKGDTGGPLQVYHTGDDITCMYDVIGITSFGKVGCAGDPAVYTRVAHYIKWIEDIVWPMSGAH